MSDLMPCQICGCEEVAYSDDIFTCSLVMCLGLDCWVAAGAKYHPGDSGTYARAEHRWNEMQTLIARGRLLDSAPKTTTKGRL